MFVDEYEKLIFFGAGKMAEYVYNQIENADTKLVACIDSLGDKRVKNHFMNVPVTSPECYTNLVREGKTAVVVCVYICSLSDVIRLLIEQYSYPEQHIFLTNPYTSCRPCVINGELGKDERTPTDSKIYDDIRVLFKDRLSLQIFDMLRKSKTYNYLGDDYELINYQDVKELLWWSEDYWNTYQFNIEGKEATVFDCGAYIGDSIEPVCRHIPYRDVYWHAFEPNEDNADQIERQDFSNSCRNLSVHRVGVGEKTEHKSFVFLEGFPEGGYISDLEGNSGEEYSRKVLKIIGLDEEQIEIRGQLFIKMDIEGAELAALKGARQTIIKNRPFLAICLYHRKNDIIEIPEYLNSILENYNYYLRGGFHTILWGIPRELDVE